ncbi:MogA/MoaB family molybdenum cofactor biosynthesis protein [Methanocalculus sp.]|uniref:MogA/MoaB family molybdenum cofactor biosynthesis protein n=1 Tax=Methanocalculus sp. TaxID=2004547 RepID=UPI00268C7476
MIYQHPPFESPDRISYPTPIPLLYPLPIQASPLHIEDQITTNDPFSPMSSHHEKEITITGAVITVSTTRKEADDTSGKTATDLFLEAGIPVSFYRIVPDQDEAIRAALDEALQKANCIVFTGGTGLTPDDRTIEAVAPAFEKVMDGFGELFRQKSIAEVGAAVILSRATAGVIQGRAVFCIPGSTKAVRLAVEEIIIPQIRHILSHAGPR